MVNLLTSPRPSLNPRPSPIQIQKREKGIGLWAVTKLSYHPTHPTPPPHNFLKLLVGVYGSDRNPECPPSVRKVFQVKVDSIEKNTMFKKNIIKVLSLSATDWTTWSK